MMRLFSARGGSKEAGGSSFLLQRNADMIMVVGTQGREGTATQPTDLYLALAFRVGVVLARMITRSGRVKKSLE